MGDRPKPEEKALLLLLFEPHSPPPRQAEGCNLTELVALSAGGGLLLLVKGWGVTLATHRAATS